MAIVTLILLLLNIFVSIQGFRNDAFYKGYSFEVDAILKKRDYKRLITSGFLHIGWQHLLLNMLCLYLFGILSEPLFGPWVFTIIYLLSLLGGNLLTLLVHRQHGDYQAVGASGAVAGIIFASVAAFHGLQVSLLFIMVPGWLFGLVYMLTTIYGIRSQRDPICHEGHLGGAITGLLAGMVFYPHALQYNTFAIAASFIPALVFLVLLFKRPSLLLIDPQAARKRLNSYSIDIQYNAGKLDQQKELDRILEKISHRGMNSLSKAEKQKLEELSRQ
jgi:membrane associated rhomboid family serine protease